jgi:hypothetical protein
MIGDPQEAAIKAAMEIALDRVQEKVKQASSSFWGRRRAAKTAGTIGAALDSLITKLRPCFMLGEPISIQQIFYEATPMRDQSWNRIHDVLNVLGAWFRGWDRMREAAGSHRSAAVLFQQIRSLYDFLTCTGFILIDIRKLIDALPSDSPASLRCKVTSDWYNRFLTDFEDLLRRLPQDMGVLDDPVMGREHFFIRF